MLFHGSQAPVSGICCQHIKFTLRPFQGAIVDFSQSNKAAINPGAAQIFSCSYSSQRTSTSWQKPFHISKTDFSQIILMLYIYIYIYPRDSQIKLQYPLVCCYPTPSHPRCIMTLSNIRWTELTFVLLIVIISVKVIPVLNSTPRHEWSSTYCLVTKWRWALDDQPLHPRGKSYQYLLDRTMCEPQVHSVRFGEQKNPSFPGIEPWFPCRTAYCLVTILTDLCQRYCI